MESGPTCFVRNTRQTTVQVNLQQLHSDVWRCCSFPNFTRNRKWSGSLQGSLMIKSKRWTILTSWAPAPSPQMSYLNICLICEQTVPDQRCISSSSSLCSTPKTPETTTASVTKTYSKYRLKCLYYFLQIYTHHIKDLQNESSPPPPRCFVPFGVTNIIGKQ